MLPLYLLSCRSLYICIGCIDKLVHPSLRFPLLSVHYITCLFSLSLASQLTLHVVFLSLASQLTPHALAQSLWSTHNESIKSWKMRFMIPRRFQSFISRHKRWMVILTAYQNTIQWFHMVTYSILQILRITTKANLGSTTWLNRDNIQCVWCQETVRLTVISQRKIMNCYLIFLLFLLYFFTL